MLNNNRIKIKKGEVLAFKTDTVWGFGALPNDSEAINKIYEIKKRNSRFISTVFFY